MIERYELKSRTLRSFERGYERFKEEKGEELAYYYYLDSSSEIDESELDYKISTYNFEFRDLNNIFEELRIIVRVYIDYDYDPVGGYYAVYNNRGEMVEDKLT